MNTFKEYGLPPSAAKGAKAHTKPLPKKKYDYTKDADAYRKASRGENKEEIERRADFQMTKKTMPDGSTKFVKSPKAKIEIGKGKNEKVDFTLPKVKPVKTKVDLKRLKKVIKFYDKPLKAKGYPEQESTHEAKIDQPIYYKVSIEGLPPLFLPGKEGSGKIKTMIRKLLKRPDMVTDMERQSGAQVRKAFRIMSQGQDIEDEVKEAVGPDDADDKGEYDYEGEMAKNQLTTMIDAATELKGMLGDDDNLPEWVQSKITKATDYIDSVRDYLKSESES